MERDADLMTVAEFMTRRVVSLPAEMPIDEALAVLDRSGFSGAPVLRDGELVGVLSEVDCVRVLASAAYNAMPVDHVHDHMTRVVQCLSPGADVFTAAQALLAAGHRRVPVCDGGSLVGLITLRDVGRALHKVQEARDAVHREQHPPGAAWDPDASRARDEQKA
jgi:CBS domain-containing protein